MRIVIPGLSGGNPFFEEIAHYSQFQFEYMRWNEISNSNLSFILFQWPELIFEWEEPSATSLNQLESKILDWKKTASIIYVVHNEKRHFGMTTNFKRLYKIVEQSADTMVHFGNYSKSLFTEKYPQKKHTVIAHPLYLKSFPRFTKHEARIKLDVPLNRFIMTVPGRVRNEQERNLVEKAFAYLPCENKTLMVPYMLRKRFSKEFKGRHLLKKVFDIKKKYESRKNDSRPPYRYFDFHHLQPAELSLYLSAADVVFIPRIDILNSGNLFLAMTFRKPFCGADRGNLKEVLAELGMPSFDPFSAKSLKIAMNELGSNNILSKSYKEEKLEQFHPQRIACLWDNLFVNYQTN